MSSYSKPFKYVISLAVALVLMWFSFRGVKWDDFIAGLRSCRWEYILLSMAAGIVAFYLRGLRWRELLMPIDPSIKRITTFNAVNIGYIANFVFPRIGELVRCGIIAGNSSFEKAEALADCGGKPERRRQQTTLRAATPRTSAALPTRRMTDHAPIQSAARQ